MNLQRLKIENIKKMFVSLGEIYNRMSDSPLKKEYRRLLYFIQSNKADIKKILDSIEKKIKTYEKSTHKIEGLDNKEVVDFWKRIKDILLNTYNDNKNIDNI